MEEGAFWHLIAQLGSQRDDAGFDRLSGTIRALPAAEILNFQDRLSEVLHRLDYRAIARQKWRSTEQPRWFPRIPGISADGFLYARCAAVIEGQSTVEGIIADHRRFARAWDLAAERLLSVAPDAFEGATGTPWDYGRPAPVSYETGSNPTGDW